MTNKLERIPVRSLVDRRRGQRCIAPERIGEIGEAEFLPAVQRVGLRAAKARGDNDPYDSIVDSGWKHWRTQVKCIASRDSGGYLISPRHRL